MKEKKEKKEKNVLVSLRIDPKEKEALECAANAKGMSLTELLKSGAYLLANFDLDFWETVKTFRRDYGIAEYLLIQSFVTIWMKHREVFPALQGTEFLFTNKGPISSKELGDLWKTIFESERKAKEAKGERP